MGPSGLLARESLSRWLRPAGIAMLLAVAIVPAALTAAWVFTHQADVAITELTWDPEGPIEGSLVNVSATVQNRFDEPVPAINVTVRIGHYTDGFDGQKRWTDAANRSFTVGPLAGGASETVTINWTARLGSWQVEAWVDRWREEVREIEKLNNVRDSSIVVQWAADRPLIPAPPGSDDPANASRPVADLEIVDVASAPAELHAGENATYAVDVLNRGPADVTNGSVHLLVFVIPARGDVGPPVLDLSEPLNLTVGERSNVTFRQPGLTQGLHALVTFAATNESARDDNLSNSALSRYFLVDYALLFQEPEEGATAKEFYRSVILLPLHFTLLVPLIGIFYAGSVLEDDRNRGNLAYVLTRPVPRWSLPLAKFSASFLVALAAVSLGILLTFLVLLATPRADVGYLWWPLLFGVLVLFLYGGVASFIGVMSERPYLVGLLYVLGFETLVLAGRRFILNDQPIVQDWVLNFSLVHWVGKAFGGWDPSEGFRWLPEDGGALKALVVMVAVGAAGLLGSAWMMSRREFQD